jgi:hypothetical protein
MENVNEYEIDGLIQTLKETGINGIMKYTDVLVLNHMCERGWIPSDREGMIKTLKEQTEMEYNEITNLLNRYNEWKQYLPSYSLGLNQKLESINKRMNSVIPFKWIGSGSGKRLIGFVNEGNQISVYDGGGNHLLKVCDIDKSKWGISWNNYLEIDPHHQHYIVGEVRNLKKMIM